MERFEWLEWVGLSVFALLVFVTIPVAFMEHWFLGIGAIAVVGVPLVLFVAMAVVGYIDRDH